MHFDCLQKEEKRKILSIVSEEYVDLDCSKILSIKENNCSEPRWMDVYVSLFNAKLPPDITIYNILLEKLSQRIQLFYFEDNGKNYLFNATEPFIRTYLWYKLTNEPVNQSLKVKYIPHKDYVKEICKLSKFSENGLYLKHVSEDKFVIEPLDLHFENIDEATKLYDQLLDWCDFYRNIKMDKKFLIENYNTVLKLSKDKRMIATVSNVTNFFDCEFVLDNECIALSSTDIRIDDEESANDFQKKVIEAYHFFRNVINTKEKKDIVSEIYNRNVSEDIKKEFESDISSYINIMKNNELTEWIVTISKESNYSLDIKFDAQGVFYINGAIIISPLDAKEYYIDLLDRKKANLALVVYKNNIVSKIKKMWNRFRAHFAKT